MSVKIKHSKGDFLFYLFNDGLLLLALLVVIYPIIYIFSASFSSPVAVMTGRVRLFPVDFSLEGYKAVFLNDQIGRAYANTVFYTVTGTLINVVMTIAAAYPLSRKDFVGKNIIMFLFTFTMIFSGGLIPNYLLIKNLGWINTIWVMIIPNAIGVYNIVIARTFYQSNISEELFEAAQIDGCDHFKFITTIVIPLSKAITAVLVLFYAVGHWNAFFDAFIYFSKKELFPLQLVLRDILIMNSIDPVMVDDPTVMSQKLGMAELLRYSLIIVASLPVWCVYPFVQKHFVKGIMVGSIKG